MSACSGSTASLAAACPACSRPPIITLSFSCAQYCNGHLYLASRLHCTACMRTALPPQTLAAPMTAPSIANPPVTTTYLSPTLPESDPCPAPPPPPPPPRSRHLVDPRFRPPAPLSEFSCPPPYFRHVYHQRPPPAFPQAPVPLHKWRQRGLQRRAPPPLLPFSTGAAHTCTQFVAPFTWVVSFDSVYIGSERKQGEGPRRA